MQCHAATRHAFMLACREEIERNGAMRDHEVLSRVKLDPPVMDANFCLELARELLRTEL